MKVGELAKKTGVTRDTIRLYEKMGLVKNVSQPYEYNNYKEYGDENVERVKLVLKMKKHGLKLQECKEIIDNIESNEDPDFHHKFLKQKIEELDQKIKELKALKTTFEGFLNSENQCKNEGDEIKKRIEPK
ncbi:MerR family transcriptional regulator [Aureivirga sp. CE67]|uniref:MerR family transcriptional regulator n=1 Tax=Aureivirga sp. CE67 TaxID=1788983 RepID=UPI0018C8D82B|nr:MerR family transcriptional regulator [Aureivirga sp. CE67]